LEHDIKASRSAQRPPRRTNSSSVVTADWIEPLSAACETILCARGFREKKCHKPCSEEELVWKNLFSAIDCFSESWARFGEPVADFINSPVSEIWIDSEVSSERETVSHNAAGIRKRGSSEEGARIRIKDCHHGW
jgi:hypothetical protein